MAYLEVAIQHTPGGLIAESANGVPLARDSGCLAFFMGSIFPTLDDYVRGLEYEGWTLSNTSTMSTLGMVDGLPFGGTQTKLIFTGSGRYRVQWQGEHWTFKE